MELINFEYSDDMVKVSVNPNIEGVIPLNEFPLKFKVEEWVNDKSIWEHELSPNTWVSWKSLRFKNLSIYTASDKLIKKHEFSPYRVDDEIHEIFYLWVASRGRTNGLVLGAGTGEWGEWVSAAVYDHCNMVLVEGDPNNIPQLIENHQDKKNIIIEPFVVSPNGGKMKFWIAPESMVSSVDIGVVKKFWPDHEPTYVEVESKSIMEIINKNFPNGIDWIRLDIEGMDYDVIMNIDDEVLQKLSMLIYEKINITEHQIKEINGKLSNNGFKNIREVGIDIFATK